jgi:hypothetical protein
MGWDIGIWIAVAALILSVVSLLWNWHHSETLFRRQEYPPVAWHLPKISKRDDRTTITTSVCNHGPKNIGDIFVNALLCSRFRVKAWCKSNVIDALPIAEPLELVLTEELEKDISERFSELCYDSGRWCFTGKPHSYKIVIDLRYQPLIADTNSVTRKMYCLLKPIVEKGTIYGWELEWIPNWKGWLPRI